MNPCWLCGGRGGWHDQEAQQSVICPECRPEPAREQADRLREGQPGWYPGIWDRMDSRYRGPNLQVKPWLLVIHSGSSGRNVAEYIASPRDGRIVSAHVCWSGSREEYVQQVSLNRVAWHCGGSEFRGNDKLNFCSLSIEAPGPAGHWWDDREEILFLRAVRSLLEVRPSLRVAVRHSDINSKKNDPGAGFRWELLCELGLELPFDC